MQKFVKLFLCSNKFHLDKENDFVFFCFCVESLLSCCVCKKVRLENMLISVTTFAY